MNISEFIKNVVCGILIGGGAILPGVSGGVLCVIFKVYQPMMELLSRPFSAIKKYWKLFLPIGIGAAIGFVGFAKLVGELFKRYEIQTLLIFIGLIFGTVPMLIKTGRKGDKSTKADLISLFAAIVILLAVLTLLSRLGSLNLKLDLKWAFISGIIWGLSLVVPGLSSSSILIFLGLYTDIMSSAGAMNLGIIIPLMAGIVVIAVLFARLVENLFNKHYSIASHAVVGLVIASTLTIIPFGYFNSIKNIAFSILLIGIGFVGAVYLDKWQNNKKKSAGID